MADTPLPQKEIEELFLQQAQANNLDPEKMFRILNEGNSLAALATQEDVVQFVKTLALESEILDKDIQEAKINTAEDYIIDEKEIAQRINDWSEEDKQEYLTTRREIIEALDDLNEEQREYMRTLVVGVDSVLNSTNSEAGIALKKAMTATTERLNSEKYRQAIKLFDFYINELHGSFTLYGFTSEGEEIFREYMHLEIPEYVDYAYDLFDESNCEELDIDIELFETLSTLHCDKARRYLVEILNRTFTSKALEALTLDFPVKVCIDYAPIELGEGEGFHIFSLQKP